MAGWRCPETQGKNAAWTGGFSRFLRNQNRTGDRLILKEASHSLDSRHIWNSWIDDVPVKSRLGSDRDLDSDYDVTFMADEATAEDILKDARRFLARVEQYFAEESATSDSNHTVASNR